MKNNFFLVILLIVFVLFGCNQKISDSRWIYVEGEHIGDVLDFKGGYYAIQNDDEIIRVDSNQLIGKVVYCKNKRLKIKSASGSLGTYKYW